MRSWAGLWVLWAGCVVGDFDSEERACPCVDGYVCDEAVNRCVRALTAPGGDDAAASDGQLPEGRSPSRCATDLANRAFCNGFEDGLAAWRTMSDTGSFGSASEEVVQTERVYQGARALRVKLGVGSIRAAVWAPAFPPSAPSEVWARAYFYFPSGKVNGIAFLEVSSSDYERRIVTNFVDDRGQLMTHGYTGQRINEYIRRIPRDEWVCVRLHVVYAEQGRMEVFLEDELLVADAFNTTTGTTTGLTRVNVGFVESRIGPTTFGREVYVDEVVVDTEPVPCVTL